MRMLHMLAIAMLLPLFSMANSSITENDKQFFIDTYAGLAILEMSFSDIPASIILAQAILESGWGRGKVAEGANNYFCIKCFNGWEGPTFNAKDDEPGLSCFRKYQTVFESFRDHSVFLKEGQRYQPLFKLEKTDYRGWAMGLKECGYATDASYGEKLIELIEEHGLWIFDYAIPVEGFATIETPVLPNDTIDAEMTISAQNQPLINGGESNGEQVLPAPTLALPQYRVEQEIIPIQTPEKEQYSSLKPEKNRKNKIRPIVPHPSVHHQRAE